MDPVGKEPNPRCPSKVIVPQRLLQWLYIVYIPLGVYVHTIKLLGAYKPRRAVESRELLGVWLPSSPYPEGSCTPNMTEFAKLPILKWRKLMEGAAL